MNRGGFIISLDFELMWGLAGHDAGYLRAYADNVRHAPEALRKIISISSKYGVKLTVAHVGGMLLNQHADIQDITPPQKIYKKQLSHNTTCRHVYFASDLQARRALFR